MNRLQMIQRVRSLTRDLSNSIFREIDISDYLNESIDRIKQVVMEMNGLSYLDGNEDVPALLPDAYHHIIPLYSASRCFGQDERHYQATNFMNEFEGKLEELKNAIESGRITITDAVSPDSTDYVVDNYFTKVLIDLDDGVEGIE